MRKIPLKRLRGVDNVELFYDLIFVYLISVLTSLLHHPHNGFINPMLYVNYLSSFLIVLQIWFYTTLLMNRYGAKSIADYSCLFINMFLLYFMASAINEHWESTAFTFNISWALILANLLVHWGVKYFRYNNLDNDDRKIIFRTMGAIATQLVIVVVAACLPTPASGWVSLAALLVGMLLWTQTKVYRLKPPNFAHLAERCALLVIVVFGETIVAISGYMTTATSPLYPVFVFALVVGLFLIYIYEYDNMLDHNHGSDGMTYMTIHAWIVVIVGNLTLALEFMTNAEFDFLPKSIFLTAFLVLYLLTSFMLGHYNKPEFHLSKRYVAGRLIACAGIVLVAVFTNFDPAINLICDTATVYLALAYEMFLYRGRSVLVGMAHGFGYTDEQLVEKGYTFTTPEGRQKIKAAAEEAMLKAEEQIGQEAARETALEAARLVREQGPDAARVVWETRMAERAREAAEAAEADEAAGPKAAAEADEAAGSKGQGS